MSSGVLLVALVMRVERRCKGRSGFIGPVWLSARSGLTAMRERLGVMTVGCRGSSLGWRWSVCFLVLEAGGPPGYGGEEEELRRAAVWTTRSAGPIRRVVWMVFVNTDESPARLLSVPAATAPAGVVSLLGGVVECVSTSPSPL
jgi:hypothetical protein